MNTLYYILPGLALGALSSLHCVGMCGAFAFSLPDTGNKWLTATLYNLGRVFSYSAIGLLAGSLGRGFYEMGWHRWLAIVAGAAMVAFTIAYLAGRKSYGIVNVAALQQWLGSWFHNRKPYAPLMIGIGNGLLPCGMVYIAIITALTTSSSIGQSVLFMMAFGLGTIPAMAALSVFGWFISPSIRSRFRKLWPAVSIIIGVLLILRGLNLGIPFLSPHISTPAEGGIPCKIY